MRLLQEDLGDSREQVLDGKRQELLAFEEETFYHFQFKREISISDQINNYTKLLENLVNLDVVIENTDKALILLSSLPDEGYETFVLTLINGKTSLNYSEMTTALVNLELRKDKKCSSSNTLVARGSTPNQRRGNQHRSNWKPMVGNRKLEKNQSVLSVKEKTKKRHWKTDCPRLNNKESHLEANVMKSDGNDSDSSYFSLFITSSSCHSDASE